MWISPWALLLALIAIAFVAMTWCGIGVAICRSLREQRRVQRSAESVGD